MVTLRNYVRDNKQQILYSLLGDLLEVGDLGDDWILTRLALKKFRKALSCDEWENEPRYMEEVRKNADRWLYLLLDSATANRRIFNTDYYPAFQRAILALRLLPLADCEDDETQLDNTLTAALHRQAEGKGEAISYESLP